MKYTIEDLKNGKCAVKSDGTFEELTKVLKLAFPNDKLEHKHYNQNAYYYLYKDGIWCWQFSAGLPSQSVKDFLEEEFILPEKWCVETNLKEVENYLIRKYGEINKWIKEQEKDFFLYSDKNTTFKKPEYVSFSFNNDYTKITLEQFKKYVDMKEEKEKRFPFKLTEENGKRIINSACLSWKSKLADKWAKDFILYGFTIIEEDFYKEMRKACTPEQNTLFDEIFGKDEEEYKVGDWVVVKNHEEAGIGNAIFTKNYITKLEERRRVNNGILYNESAFVVLSDAGFYTQITKNCIKRKATDEEIEKVRKVCPYKDGELIFVKDDIQHIWALRYSTGKMINGKAEVYFSQKKFGETVLYTQHAPTNGLTLPD